MTWTMAIGSTLTIEDSKVTEVKRRTSGGRYRMWREVGGNEKWFEEFEVGDCELAVEQLCPEVSLMVQDE